MKKRYSVGWSLVELKIILKNIYLNKERNIFKDMLIIS